MKSPLITFLVCICTSLGIAQVKIGENPQTIDAASLLELESNSKVLVISRMSEAEILSLSPLQGAVVYNTDAACIFYYDGLNWNNLCDGGSTGSISWGAITGNLTDQADLAAELDNYVDLSTTQSIAGEKTLNDKLTVDTGSTTDQVAEFLGRVKGEDGKAPEDFVTKAQLDASGAAGGGGTWGSITGTLVNQTDLTTEFQNYVNLTTAQSIAGEKTLNNKLTVDTGTTTDQVAEFLGRVKGEDGTAPEDFVTKAQLDASGAGGVGGTWGSITGTLANQTDLTTEFQNYVNLTADQSIAGAKTLSNKLTVDTGDTTEQVAEFLGRVKGENGLEDEDFVTWQQLRAVQTTGASGITGSIFFAGEDTGLTEKNGQLFWDNTINQLRVGGNAPIGGTTNSVLNLQGSVSKPIAFNTNGLDRRHHTVIMNQGEGTTITMFLPSPGTCIGRIYIIKKKPLIDLLIQGGYLDTDSEFTSAVDDNVLHLQSNGFQWEQIN